MSDFVDPEIAALNTVCSALAPLESDEARQRVLEFTRSRFGLKGGAVNGRNIDGES